MEVYTTLEVHACSACGGRHYFLTAKYTGKKIEFSCPIKGEEVEWDFDQEQGGENEPERIEARPPG